jgi:ribokinase
MNKLTVIGSINMDLVVGVERFPNPGETLTGTRFTTVPGGKGANQAVALARLGARVSMAGRVGRDGFGDQYLEHFQREGVDVSLVERSCAATGVALIEVDASGENHIVVVPGANHLIDPEWTRRMLEGIDTRGIVLMQLEIPMEAVLAAARRVAQDGGMLVLDPAPMQPMPDELLRHAYIVTPNEHELQALTQNMPKESTIHERMAELMRRGAKRVLNKRGAQGAYLLTEDGMKHIPAFAVKAVDSTAAGDSFNAALAFSLAEGRALVDCVRFACAVGALATTKFGAQAGMPTLAEAESFLSNAP